MILNTLASSFSPISIVIMALRNSSEVSHAFFSSSSVSVPLPSSSMLLQSFRRVIFISRSLFACSCCLRSTSFSRASVALSTMTARMRFMKPRETHTRAAAKSTKEGLLYLMMGTMQAPHESPATRVWKNRSDALKTDPNASLQKMLSGSWASNISWLMGLMTSSAMRDQNMSSTMISTRPQNIAFMAPKKPLIMMYNSGYSLIHLTARSRRAMRRTRSIGSTEKALFPPAPLVAKSMISSNQPKVTMQKSSTFQVLQKYLDRSTNMLSEASTV
mmetsp:Transcript_31475/g.93486  ORF Transcript_31475/g.93486 Transcript_31475/m.93486 type:complete len:274 (+) Transcript_31475:304-1125(+)